jgi:hypothetical protein
MAAIGSVGARGPGDRKSAQQRADQINAFARELGELARADVLTLLPEERERVARYHADVLTSLAAEYDVDRTERQRQMTLGMQLASLLGAVTLSASVVLLFYRVWGALATPVQLVVLIAMPLLMLPAVEFAARREPTRYVASVLSLIAAASFALNLVVVWAIFNMAPTPLLLAGWAAFALALAYSHGFRLLLAGGVAAALSAVTAAIAQGAGLDWTASLARPEPLLLLGPLAVALSFWRPVARHDGFAQTWRLVGVALLLLPLLFLSTWPEVFSYRLLPLGVLHAVYDPAGFLVPLLVAWYGIRRRFPELVSAAAAFLVLFVYAKCFDWWWAVMPRYLFFLLLGGLAVGTMVALAKLRHSVKGA